MGTSLVTALGCVVSVCLLFAWYRYAPAKGSGWILYYGVISAIGSGGIQNNVPGSLYASIVICAFASFIWFKSQQVPRFEWVMFVALISAMSIIDKLLESVSGHLTASFR